VLFGFLFLRDRHYFIPFAAHSDLRFQIVGESVEILTLLVSFTACFVAFSWGKDQARPRQGSSGLDFVSGAFFAGWFLAVGWRSFFPNNQFEFSAGADELVGDLFAGFAIGFFGNAFDKKSGKPSPEDERSVV
jgi:hypothetical protein